uniref:Transposase n=1 Tax=Acrobeloides nanus TaxID=290746 RepID=A0A914D463_9BILA
MPGKPKSEEIKKLIIEAKQAGETDRVVAARFHVSQGTVSNIYKRWREERTVKRRRGSGRPRKTTHEQARLLVRQVKKDPFMTAVQMAQYERDHLNVNISDRTARRILANAALPARTQVQGLSDQILNAFLNPKILVDLYLLPAYVGTSTLLDSQPYR